MKLLYVYSDDDYAALTFEQSELGKKSYKEVYDFVFNEHGGSYENEEEGFTIDCYEFEGVTLTDEFIDFLNDKKDYDMTKHEDWFVVEKE